MSGVISLSAAANGAGLSSLQFQASGQNIGSSITSGSCTRSWDTTTVPNGVHTLTAIGADSLGVTVLAAPVLVTVQNAAPADTTAPTVSLTAPGSGASVSGTTSLTANASDNAGVSGVWFTVDGNTVGSEDVSAPYQASWATTSIPNGAHTVRAMARDAAGNIGTSATITVTVSNTSVDTTAPTVSIIAPAAGATVSGSTSISATASDNVGVTSVQFSVDGVDVGAADTTSPYSISWSTTAHSNGAHTVRAVARDAAGNTTLSSTVSVTVQNAAADTSAPIVSLTAPSAGSSVSGTVTISATASDNVGVTNVQFSVDGIDVGVPDTSAPYSTSWTTSGHSNGAHTVRATARDAAGNTTQSSAVTVTVQNAGADSTAPVVSLTAPSAGATVNGIVTISATASDNVGVTSVQFTMDGINVGSADTTSPYSASWTTSSASNGSHVLRAVARDAAGNVTTSSGISVTVSNVSSDGTRPNVGLTAPASGSTVSGDVTVSASASDNVAVVSVQFTVDGVNIGAPDTAAPWSTTWNSTAVVNGYRVLRAIAYDAAGNSRISTSRTVTVNNPTPDTTAPSVNLTAPANGATVGGVVNLAASASDNVGVVGVQFMLNGGAVGPEDTSAPYSLTWQSTEVSNGPQQVTAVARDAAGNRRTSSAITIAVANETGSGVPGDLNSDGTPDLLFMHSTGRLYSWFMRDNELSGQGLLTPEYVPQGWAVATVNDFNADGKSDLVLQNTSTGEVDLWAMDGLVRIGEADLLGSGTPWRIAGSLDLNNDDHADLIWRLPTTGELYVWLMNGPNMIGSAPLSRPQVNPAWRLAGTGDFDGNGQDDLLWQNDATGELVSWLLSGFTVAEERRLTPGVVGTSWRVRSVGDFDGNGKQEIVFQNESSGHLYMWYMDGGIMLERDRFVSPSRVGSGWKLVGGQ